jgi:phosphoglycerate dehydrogenase-like enzyme
MILAFTRGIRAFIHHQDQHSWSNRQVRGSLVELTNSTLGIVGFGSVGRALAKRAQAFGMRILAVDVYPTGKPEYVERLTGTDGLPELLSDSDYVVTTVPLVAATRHMIGAAEIARMKPTAILVGISRGGVIDEDALVEALQTGRLKAAALDVFEAEPLPADSPLWDIDNLLITPHAAGGSQYEAAHVREIFLENVDRFLAEDFPLRNQIDKIQGF